MEKSMLQNYLKRNSRRIDMRKDKWDGKLQKIKKYSVEPSTKQETPPLNKHRQVQHTL